ncbi:MAG: long-chain fatty acid--CoA ligase [Spirochaetes bacterium]|nr:MAG: long-chain fatty acid--CoA ligase [Spirochaetota bacterium]
MDKLRSQLGGLVLNEDTVVGIEFNTYMRYWDKVKFLSREKNGYTTQDFVPTTGGDFIEQQLYLAAGLLELNVEKGETVAVFSQNSIRYAASLFAIFSIGAVFVPVYPTTTEEEVEQMLRHSETRTIFAGEIAEYQKALAILDKVKSPLRRVIACHHMDAGPENVITYEKLIKLGRTSNRLPEVIDALKNMKGDDLAALFYTPGTTGEPKGALLSHANFASQRCVMDILKVGPRDVKLCHLPFSHVFGLSADVFSCATTGALMGIMRSFETGEMLAAMAEVRPTIICSVPRMFEKIRTNVLQEIQNGGGVRKTLFSLAVRTGTNIYMRRCKKQFIPPHAFALRLLLSPVYRSIRKSIRMARVRLLISGGGPLPVEVAYFFGGLGLSILEGYGLTETSPVMNVNPPYANKPGTVGPPIPGCEEKISDEGEVLVRGPMVCRGYHLNDEETRFSFTPDGFFRTGDIGTFDADGYLTITGRIKDLIITSAGKNIAPLHIEKRFQTDQYISNFCAIGDGRKYISALIVPNFGMLRTLAREMNIPFKGNEDLIARPEIVKFYKERVGEISSTLAKFEQVKKFTLLADEFSVETGEISPTFKFRRHAVQDKYKSQIDMMYPSSDALHDEF